MPLFDAAKKIHGDNLPPVWAMFLGPMKSIIINSPEYLEDIYVRFNSFHSKHEDEQKVFNLLIPTSILFMQSDDKDYV